MKILFDNTNYSVRLIDTPIPVENSGVTLYFHYETYNKVTDRVEGFSQFLPSAIDQAEALNYALEDTLNEGGGECISDTDGNVVKLNS
ncbi:MAG: hypothetical protein OCD76_07255 [Reichenbachiella sp.]